MKQLNRVILFLLILFSLGSCVKEESYNDTVEGNFEALWTILDEHYCFFEEKADSFGTDWDEIHLRYNSYLKNISTTYHLFDLCDNMLKELRDGHVNLIAPHNVSVYSKWYEDYPTNYSDTLERIYLGTTDEYYRTSGLEYRILNDNIAYIRCSSFTSSFGDGNLNEIFRYSSACRGLIIDVRNNGGGLLTSAQKLASCFINTEQTLGYIAHKTGKGHNEFSTPSPITIKPFTGLRWQKPVAVLTNRKSYSATNSFVMYMKKLPMVTIVGDRTGGGGGMPMSLELPNGWSVRFSACPMYDKDMNCIEMGIEPDIKVDLLSSDLVKGYDTIIEEARQHINNL